MVLGALETAPDDRIEPILFAPTAIAHFTILRELGRGGMGIVYEAHDPDLDRNVAIKVVRDRGAGSAAGTRLIFEAQAMARLAHPNVVGVHEVGTIDDQVYVAMELVRGDTLSGWLRTPRPWREIVAMFLQAGEGLLAAHRAGLIHRDFKPSNVLVDHGGRARVGDFGLARSGPTADEPNLAVGSNNSGIVGTPAYMAPEQRFGAPIDARVDQFAFAVSLDRVLESEHALGKPPRRVRAALARARSIDREERFAGMTELLFELRASLAARRRRALALAIACTGIALAGATTLLATRPASDPCGDGADLVDEVWNPHARATQLGHFLRARPGASIAGSSTANIVDDWVEQWRLGRKAACTVDQPQRDYRLGCLDGQLQELRAQVSVWADADASTVDRAVQAATMLPSPQACTASSADPIDPALRGTIATLDALLRSGRARQAQAGIANMLARAEGHPLALATALLTAGRVEREAGNSSAARDYLKRAAHEAGRANDDSLLLEALLEETTVIVDLGRPRDALGLLDAADALQARGHVDAVERIAMHRADALGQAGRAKESIAETMRVLPQIEARAQRDPAARAQLSTALGQLAAAQLQIDREAARTTLVRALSIDESQYGPEHPEVAKTLHDLGAAELQLERYDEASAHLDRALKIFIRSYGERHPMVGATYMAIAHVALNQNHFADAKRLYLSARDALTGVVAEDAPHLIAIEEGLGDIARGEDNCKEALPHYARAVKLLEQSGHGENEHAMQLTNLGNCLQDTGRVAEARDALQRSLAEIDHLQMPNKWKSEPLALLADMEAAAGHMSKAIELEKAALAALEGVAGSDAAALQDYEKKQLAAWTKR